jgi:hypothetical protein
VESKNTMVWSTLPLEAWQGFPGGGGLQGTLEGTIPNAPLINIFISFLKIVFHGFEDFGEQKNHGVEYIALGSSARFSCRWRAPHYVPYKGQVLMMMHPP